MKLLVWLVVAAMMTSCTSSPSSSTSTTAAAVSTATSSPGDDVTATSEGETTSNTTTDDVPEPTSNVNGPAGSPASLLDDIEAWSALPPNPAAVAVDVDEQGAVVATVGADGGTIAATAPDGTDLVLDIPAHALLAPVEITMTPITAITGDIFDVDPGVHGARLEPDGLVLLTPARLELTGTMGGPASVGWAAGGDGDNFHLDLTTATDHSLVLSITHFSVHGVIGARNLDDILRRYRPDGVADRIVDVVSASMAVGADTYDTLVAMLEQARGFGEVVRTRLQAADSDSDLEQATGNLFTYFKIVGTLFELEPVGTPPGEPPGPMQSAIEALRTLNEELTVAWLEAIDAAIDRAAERCWVEQDPEATFTILRWSLIAQYVIGSFIGSRAEYDLAAEIVDRWSEAASGCFTFEMEYTTTVTISGDGGGASTSTSGVAELAPTREGFNGGLVADGYLASPQIVGPFEITNFSIPAMSGAQCVSVVSPGELAYQFRADLQLRNLGDLSRTEIDAMKAGIKVNRTVGLRCKGLEYDMGDAFWRFYVSEANKHETIQGWSQFDVPIVRRGDVYARWENVEQPVSVQGGSATVTQKIVLRHTPRG
jgi:hypothetical protein